LLLGTKPATEPLLSSSTTSTKTSTCSSSDNNNNNNNNKNDDNNNTKLLKSLIHYRDQLDALKGAIWSQCVLDDLPTDQRATMRREWWSQVIQLGATCRALEDEIGQTFFFEVEEENNVNNGEESNIRDPARDESGSYEHGVEQQSEKTNKEGGTQTKTIVFRGKGAKQDRPKSNNNTNTKTSTKNVGASDGGEPLLLLPPRDTVSEQQLVNELKNRIKTICPADDDDEDWEDVDPNAIAGRQPATSHFLGATGTLLSELKGSLPLMDTAGEEILGE
jgi:hypothetical protein